MLVIAAIVGPVAGAVSTVVLTYVDVKAKARDTNQKTEAGYNTLAPALKELQEIIADGQEWANDTDEELRMLERDRDDQEKRIIRLEAYIEILGATRNLPDAPPLPAGGYSPMPDENFTTGYYDEPPRPKTRKPERPIPANVGRAKDYQQQRMQEMCPPSDPLCGALK